MLSSYTLATVLVFVGTGLFFLGHSLYSELSETDASGVYTMVGLGITGGVMIGFSYPIAGCPAIPFFETILFGILWMMVDGMCSSTNRLVKYSSKIINIGRHPGMTLKRMGGVIIRVSYGLVNKFKELGKSLKTEKNALRSLLFE